MAKHKTLFSFFSPETNRFYRLFETDSLPCLEISGVRMHCFKDSSVAETTKRMVFALGQLKGNVLDTCCGLGYTAIEIASRPGVNQVCTFEIDQNVLEVARNNPASAKLFSDKKIVVRLEDAAEGIKSFPGRHFDAILHDPPSISIAGELYGRPFYAGLFRVLKNCGTLFHYTGQTGEKSGKDLPASTMKRLQETGFVQCKRFENPAGVVCRKPLHG
ncbi:MAG: methyltransferase [Candidatus Diapherotrites archaeon]|nr:methyltransferase [Candidatus Diapherotrites archaeon]